MKTIEYWRWRYRDVRTGQICRTMFQLTAEEAAAYPEAERIDGSMLLREVDDDDVESRDTCGTTVGGARRSRGDRSAR